MKQLYLKKKIKNNFYVTDKRRIFFLSGSRVSLDHFQLVGNKTMRFLFS